MMDIERIFKHLQEGRMDESFKILSDFIEVYRSDLISLESRYGQLNRRNNQGLIDYEKYELKNNEIRENLIKIIARLEDVALNTKETLAAEKAKDNPLKRLLEHTISENGYRLQEEIDKGMMNTFFLAKRRDLFEDKRFVVQVFNQYRLAQLSKSHNKKRLRFFSDRHEPFISIDSFSAEYPCYIIRAYIDGMNLYKLIRSGIKLSLVQLLDTTISIAKGLGSLHRHRLIHDNLIPGEIILDLKNRTHILPMNIFEHDQKGTTWRQLKSAIRYTSPEEVSDLGKSSMKQKLTPACNQYSLGLILFFMLTGESLFDGDDLMALYEDRLDSTTSKQQINGFNTSILERLRFYNIPKAKCQILGQQFIQIFNRLLQEKPENRYEDMDELIGELQSLKLAIEDERAQVLSEELKLIQKSYQRCIYERENCLHDFHARMEEELPAKESIQKDETSHIRLHYTLQYMFESVATFEEDKYVLEAASCFYKKLYPDFTTDEYRIFWNILIETVEAIDVEWNDKTKAAWTTMVTAICETIESLFAEVV